jgi:hypothetical protein
MTQTTGLQTSGGSGSVSKARNAAIMRMAAPALSSRARTLYFHAMDKARLISYLEGIDRALASTATLYIYGSAACILLDEPDRTSLDIDVAGPYSNANEADLRRAAESVGLPVNPGETYGGDHMEWIGSLRLCLQPPVAGRRVTLWQGERLRIDTGPVADLVASKLIRYDAIDRRDIQYLLVQSPAALSDIEAAVARLPVPFARDPLVRENLENLRADMSMWGMRT